MPPVAIRYEQAVYGSFPFWDRGYAILARSPGCRDEWLADLRHACQRYGERPPGAAEAGGLVALRLPSGPWSIIGPCPQGCDDAGRPGALAFHALFVSGSDYRKAGAFPFAFAGLLCGDWTAETTLPAGTLVLDEPIPAAPSPPADPRASRIAAALARGRRVAIEAPGPIDDLARSVWRALPLRRRARLSLATWTFANGNRHDLAALPRLVGVALDPSYVDPDAPPAPSRIGPGRGSAPVSWEISPVARALWVGLAAVTLAAIGLAWRGPGGTSAPVPPPAGVADRRAFEVPPRPRDDPDGRLAPDRRRQAEEGLISLAERFRTLEDVASVSRLTPDALMMRLRERLTYDGPVLTPAELGQLAHSTDRDEHRAADWHAHITLFRPDRPLPPDFADRPLGRQLRTLAWSFHLDPADIPDESIPRSLAESLSLPFPVRLPAAADRYPALADYARFLRRLPAR